MLCLQNKVPFPVSVMFILMHSHHFPAATWVLVFQFVQFIKFFTQIFRYRDSLTNIKGINNICQIQQLSELKA